MARDRYAVKVAQRSALIARVEAAALRGEVDAANTAAREDSLRIRQWGRTVAAAWTTQTPVKPSAILAPAA